MFNSTSSNFNKSFHFQFIESEKEQSLLQLKESIISDEGNNQLKKMVLFVHSYYKKSNMGIVTLDEKKACKEIMLEIATYSSLSENEAELEAEYVIYNQLIRDIEIGIEGVFWEPLSSNREINPPIDIMKRRKKEIKQKLAELQCAGNFSSDLPILKQLSLKISELHKLIMSENPISNDTQKLAVEAIHKVIDYNLTRKNEYRAYIYLLKLSSEMASKMDSKLMVEKKFISNSPKKAKDCVNLDTGYPRLNSQTLPTLNVIKLKKQRVQAQYCAFDIDTHLFYFRDSVNNFHLFNTSKKVKEFIYEFNLLVELASERLNKYALIPFNAVREFNPYLNTPDLFKEINDLFKEIKEKSSLLYSNSNSMFSEWEYYKRAINSLSEFDTIAKAIYSNTMIGIKQKKILSIAQKMVCLSSFCFQDNVEEWKSIYKAHLISQRELLSKKQSELLSGVSQLDIFFENPNSASELSIHEATSIREVLCEFFSNSKTGAWSIENFLKQSSNQKHLILNYSLMRSKIDALQIKNENVSHALEGWTKRVQREVEERVKEIPFNNKLKTPIELINLLAKNLDGFNFVEKETIAIAKSLEKYSIAVEEDFFESLRDEIQQYLDGNLDIPLQINSFDGGVRVIRTIKKLQELELLKSYCPMIDWTSLNEFVEEKKCGVLKTIDRSQGNKRSFNTFEAEVLFDGFVSTIEGAHQCRLPLNTIFSLFIEALNSLKVQVAESDVNDFVDLTPIVKCVLGNLENFSKKAREQGILQEQQIVEIEFLLVGEIQALKGQMKERAIYFIESGDLGKKIELESNNEVLIKIIKTYFQLFGLISDIKLINKTTENIKASINNAHCIKYDDQIARELREAGALFPILKILEKGREREMRRDQLLENISKADSLKKTLEICHKYSQSEDSQLFYDLVKQNIKRTLKNLIAENCLFDANRKVKSLSEMIKMSKLAIYSMVREDLKILIFRSLVEIYQASLRKQNITGQDYLFRKLNECNEKSLSFLDAQLWLEAKYNEIEGMNIEKIGQVLEFSETITEKITLSPYESNIFYASFDRFKSTINESLKKLKLITGDRILSNIEQAESLGEIIKVLNAYSVFEQFSESLLKAPCPNLYEINYDLSKITMVDGLFELINKTRFKEVVKKVLNNTEIDIKVPLFNLDFEIGKSLERGQKQFFIKAQQLDKEIQDLTAAAISVINTAAAKSVISKDSEMRDLLKHFINRLNDRRVDFMVEARSSLFGFTSNLENLYRAFYHNFDKENGLIISYKSHKAAAQLHDSEIPYYTFEKFQSNKSLFKKFANLKLNIIQIKRLYLFEMKLFYLSFIQEKYGAHQDVDAFVWIILEKFIDICNESSEFQQNHLTLLEQLLDKLLLDKKSSTELSSLEKELCKEITEFSNFKVRRANSLTETPLVLDLVYSYLPRYLDGYSLDLLSVEKEFIVNSIKIDIETSVNLMKQLFNRCEKNAFNIKKIVQAIGYGIQICDASKNLGQIFFYHLFEKTLKEGLHYHQSGREKVFDDIIICARINTSMDLENPDFKELKNFVKTTPRIKTFTSDFLQILEPFRGNPQLINYLKKRDLDCFRKLAKAEYISNVYDFDVLMKDEKLLKHVLRFKSILEPLSKHPEYEAENLKKFKEFFDEYANSLEKLEFLNIIFKDRKFFNKKSIRDKFIEEILGNKKKLDVFFAREKFIRFFMCYNFEEYPLESVIFDIVLDSEKYNEIAGKLENHFEIVSKPEISRYILEGLELLNLTRATTQAEFRYFVYLRFGILLTVFNYIEQNRGKFAEPDKLSYTCRHKDFIVLETTTCKGKRFSLEEKFATARNSSVEVRQNKTITTQLHWDKMRDDTRKRLGLKSKKLSDKKDGQTRIARGHISFFPKIVGNAFHSQIDEKNPTLLYFLGNAVELEDLLSFTQIVWLAQEQVTTALEGKIRNQLNSLMVKIALSEISALQAFKKILIFTRKSIHANHKQFLFKTKDELKQTLPYKFKMDDIKMKRDDHFIKYEQYAWKAYCDFAETMLGSGNKELKFFNEIFNSRQVYNPVQWDWIDSKSKYVTKKAEGLNYTK